MKDGNTEFDKQFGLPNGYDSHTIADAPSGSFVGLENTSNFNINTILRLDAPTIFLMPSETKLLLAEAVLRNWTNGNAEVLYKEAITSSMKEQEIAYGTQGKITDEEIETYLAPEPTQYCKQYGKTANYRRAILGSNFHQRLRKLCQLASYRIPQTYSNQLFR